MKAGARAPGRGAGIQHAHPHVNLPSSAHRSGSGGSSFAGQLSSTRPLLQLHLILPPCSDYLDPVPALRLRGLPFHRLRATVPTADVTGFSRAEKDLAATGRRRQAGCVGLSARRLLPAWLGAVLLAAWRGGRAVVGNGPVDLHVGLRLGEVSALLVGAPLGVSTVAAAALPVLDAPAMIHAFLRPRLVRVGQGGGRIRP